MMKRSLPIRYVYCFLLMLPLTLSAATEVDSIKQVVETMPEDSMKCATYLRIAFLLYNGPEAINYSYRALDLAKALGEQQLLGKAYHRLAWCLHYDEMDKKVALLDSSAMVYDRLGDLDGLGLTYDGRGSILMHYGSLEEANEAYIKAYDYYSQSENEERKAGILNNWGICMNLLEQPEEAIAKYQTALDYRLQEQPENPVAIARIYFGLGQSAELLEDLEVATTHYFESYKYRDKVKNIAVAENLIAIADMAYKGAKKGLDTMGIFRKIQSLGFANTQALLDSAAVVPGVAERLGFTYYIKDVRRKGELLRGNYQVAYQLLQDLKTMDEEAKLSDASLGAFADLKIQYEKEQLKTRLLEEEITNRKKKNQVNLLILSLGVLLSTLIIGTLVYQNRLRAKSLLLATARQEQQIISMRSMLEGQEKERARIARDLHDGLGNLLSTLKASVSNLQISFTNNKTEKIYSKASDMIDEACTEVRKIAHEMMPQALSKLGLKKALGDLIQKMDDTHDFEADIQVYGKEQILDDSTNVMLYRIVQELLNNIVKYAEAKEVLVQITYSEEWLSLTVEDDGKGFEPDKILDNEGMGLKSIAFRTEYIGGEYEIDSRPGAGTLVSINVPLRTS